MCTSQNMVMRSRVLHETLVKRQCCTLGYSRKPCTRQKTGGSWQRTGVFCHQLYCSQHLPTTRPQLFTGSLMTPGQTYSVDPSTSEGSYKSQQCCHQHHGQLQHKLFVLTPAPTCCFLSDASSLHTGNVVPGCLPASLPGWLASWLHVRPLCRVRYRQWPLI